jgi:Tol biopolymer transport system component
VTDLLNRQARHLKGAHGALPPAGYRTSVYLAVRWARHVLVPTIMVLVAALSASCDLFTGPDLGSLRVVVVTDGGSLDKDGYTVAVDSIPVGTLGVQDSLVIDSVATSTALVGLEGIAENCAVEGPNPVEVQPSGGGTRVLFRVRCIPQLAFRSHRDGNNEVYLVNEDGSGLVNLTNHPANDGGPAWSPDGTRLAFVSDRDGYFLVHVMNADGSGVARLTDEVFSEWVVDQGPVWSPDGSKIVFRRSLAGAAGEATLLVWDLLSSTLIEVSGPPAGGGEPTWSPDGQRLAFSSSLSGDAEVYVVNADGTGLTNITHTPGGDGSPTWSPDGSRIAFHSVRDGHSEVYVAAADGGGAVNITQNPALDFRPRWSPVASVIAFGSDRDGNAGLYVIDVDTGITLRLTPDPYQNMEHVWDPAGITLAFVTNRAGNYDIYLVTTDGSGSVVPLTLSTAWDDQPAWRP